jgi:threonine dehydratase
MCRDLLDDTMLVTEEEIYRAMQVLFYEDRIVAEGACVVGLAAVLAARCRPDRPHRHHHHRAQPGYGDVHRIMTRAGRDAGRDHRERGALWP